MAKSNTSSGQLDPGAGSQGARDGADSDEEHAETTQRGAALVDPTVSRAKFERELQNYRAQEEEYRRRGWFLLDAVFPDVSVLMAAPAMNPPPVIYGLKLNFLDYDLRPPSVQFVSPFTGAPLTVKQVRPLLKRAEAQPPPGGPQEADSRAVEEPGDGMIPRPESGSEGGDPVVHRATNLVQGHGDNPAFLCVPGTREYHEHPYHTNDPWLAHRGRGPGTLHYLLDIVWRHGIRPLVGWHVQFNVGPRLDPRRIL